MNGFNGHGDLAGTFHPDLGKFLVRHERPGALVAFQDMGSTPYHAPDINFLDFFGLVDKTVAHARHDYGPPRLRRRRRRATSKPKFDAADARLLLRARPEWAILTIYTPRGRGGRSSPRSSTRTRRARSSATRTATTTFQFGSGTTRASASGYVPVRTWPRSAVVLPRALAAERPLGPDAARGRPRRAARRHRRREGDASRAGLELLGSELTHDRRSSATRRSSRPGGSCRGRCRRTSTSSCT